MNQPLKLQTLLIALTCSLIAAGPSIAQPSDIQSSVDPRIPQSSNSGEKLEQVQLEQVQPETNSPDGSKIGAPPTDTTATTVNQEEKAEDTNKLKHRAQKAWKKHRERRESSRGAGGIRKSVDVNVPNIQERPTLTLPIPFDTSSVSGQALNLVLNRKIDEARTLLSNTYEEQKKSGKLDSDIPYFLAAIESHTEHYPQALKLLAETQTLKEKQGLDVHSHVLLTKRIGDCHYRNHNLKEALTNYKAAMFMAQQDPNLSIVLTSEILESIVGCENRLKEFAAAERDCRSLIDSTRAQLHGGGIPAVLSYSWSMIQLSEILKRAGRQDEHKVAQSEWQSLMSQIVNMRSIAERAGILPEFEEVANMFRVAYVKAMAPKTPAEIAWAGNDFRIKSMPIIVWSPAGSPQAAILCVHGLGLDNHSFTHTAKQLTARGYLVAALDVRGFGAWVNTRGEEDLDYESCLGDISDAVALFKKKNPGLPVYVLGESMGGAIALRAAAKLGPKINGVISSVPGAERFQQRKMSIQTAMHFIIDPKKPFDVGDYVAERATSQDSTRKEWAADSKARLDLSPVELLKFAVFMRTTKRCAEDIKEIPVLMLQGLKDRLVKPKGTFDLFEAISSEDKSMIVQGLSEHLMFETSSPDPAVIDAVDSWLRQRNTKPPQQETSKQ